MVTEHLKQSLNTLSFLVLPRGRRPALYALYTDETQPGGNVRFCLAIGVTLSLQEAQLSWMYNRPVNIQVAAQ
jgi:hypothetical protein